MLLGFGSVAHVASCPAMSELSSLRGLWNKGCAWWIEGFLPQDACPVALPPVERQCIPEVETAGAHLWFNQIEGRRVLLGQKMLVSLYRGDHDMTPCTMTIALIMGHNPKPYITLIWNPPVILNILAMRGCLLSCLLSTHLVPTDCGF